MRSACCTRVSDPELLVFESCCLKFDSGCGDKCESLRDGSQNVFHLWLKRWRYSQPIPWRVAQQNAFGINLFRFQKTLKAVSRHSSPRRPVWTSLASGSEREAF